MEMFLSKIERGLVQVARREIKCVFRDRGNPGFVQLYFEEILTEMPTVFTILSTMIQFCPN